MVETSSAVPQAEQAEIKAISRQHTGRGAHLFLMVLVVTAHRENKRSCERSQPWPT
jgi:hypothetical protein